MSDRISGFLVRLSPPHCSVLLTPTPTGEALPVQEIPRGSGAGGHLSLRQLHVQGTYHGALADGGVRESGAPKPDVVFALNSGMHFYKARYLTPFQRDLTPFQRDLTRFQRYLTLASPLVQVLGAHRSGCSSPS
jgi:hypothetical protein